MQLRIALLVPLTVACIAPAQDHSYTQADIEAGAQAYRTNCIGCHGADGASVSGIDLGRGKFKVAKTDDDLVRILLNGVPGSAMPPTPIPRARAHMIVAYLRIMHQTVGRRSIAAAKGDPIRGKPIFENQCGGCHRIRGSGGRSGPDLSDVGHRLRAIEIETAILEPDAGFPPGTRPVRVVPNSGPAFSGLLLNQDSYSLQMIDQEGSLRSIDRAGLKEEGPTPSWMPSYRGKLDAGQLADLIAYLAGQKGVQ